MNQALHVLQSLSFSQPLVLWFLILVVALVVLAPRARLRMTSVPLRIGVLGIRLVIAGLLVAALAEPTLRPAGHGRAVVFAIDVSDSLSPDQQLWARNWVSAAISALPPGSHSDTIEFGERAQLVGSTPPPGGTTDLTAALRLAATLVPREPSLAPAIVLLTDGWQTVPSSPRASPADAVPAGIRVSYVQIPPSTAAGQRPGLAVVHSLDVPPIARAGDRIDVTIGLQAATAVDAQLRLSLDRMVVADGPVHLEAGDTRLSLPQRVAAAGFVEVRAELQVAEQTMKSTLSAVVVAKPAGRVLVLEDDAPVKRDQADGLVALLQGEGLEVDRRPASSLPPSASALSTYDGLVLVNTPATSLSLDQQRTLVAFVQDLGRGLLVVGGARTFAPGGYQGTPLDDLLPVSAEPPIEPQQGGLALFLVIDRSGSMDMRTGAGTSSAGATKMAMANEAAIEAIGLLQPQDTAGVIAFDSSFQWVVPPTKLSGLDDAKRAQALISKIKAGGGTSILPPLEAAYQAALNADAPLKHIILLTDGESNDHGYEDLIARMKADRITLSTLAIGSDADTRLLSNLAHIGGGRYYFTERGTQIPRIASKETTILTRNAVIEGQVAALVADPSPILRSLSGDLPALSGYVATTRKDRAVTALETEKGHPLLAHWQYGLGRVVVWTSEAQQGWASDWAKWPDAAQFWSQAVRWSLPAPVRADFQPSAQLGPDGRQVTLQVQALRDDAHFADLQDTRATVVAPDGSAREVRLPQTGPGTYGLETRIAGPGTYRVLFAQGARQEVAGFSAPDAIEMHSVGINRALLDLLATTSGGHELANAADFSQPGNGPGPAITLWPWLLGLALVLLPLDVFLRRRA
jgi:Ca-activated chloride channel homolog